MLRIRGTVGDLPVDLTLELDDGDWARLGAQLQAAPVPSAPAAVPAKQDDDLWQNAQDLLRKAGQLSGLELLDQLEGLAGDASAGKRLLVRLRHSAKVKVASAIVPRSKWPAAGIRRCTAGSAISTAQRTTCGGTP